MGDYNEKNQGQQQAADREGGQKDQQGAPGRNPDGGKSAGGQQGADKDKEGGQDRQGGQGTREPGEKEETRR